MLPLGHVENCLPDGVQRLTASKAESPQFSEASSEIIERSRPPKYLKILENFNFFTNDQSIGHPSGLFRHAGNGI